MEKTKKQIFINKANAIHNDKYHYVSEYINSRTKITINCPIHGDFEQTPASHLKGRGCRKCGLKMYDNNIFIDKVKNIHDDKYDYSKLEYVDKKRKIKIICPEHGIFEQLPNTHLSGSGCPKCSFKKIHDNNKSNSDEFIIKSKLVHGDKYDYSLVEYKKNNVKVKIICPEHGEFEQTPNDHKKGSECKKCANIKTGKAAVENSRGWSLTDWENKLKKSPEAKPILYVIKCSNYSESFIKIGITMRTIKKRFSNKKLMPYDFETILEINGLPNKIFNTEIKIKQILKEFNYKPNIKFSGWNECFEIKTLNKMVKLINKEINE